MKYVYSLKNYIFDFFLPNRATVIFKILFISRLYFHPHLTSISLFLYPMHMCVLSVYLSIYMFI